MGQGLDKLITVRRLVRKIGNKLLVFAYIDTYVIWRE